VRVRIWLASFPRSGNTLLRLILKSLYDVGSSSVYAKQAGDPNGPEGSAAPAPTASSALLAVATAAHAGPVHDLDFTKTHELDAAEDTTPAVYVARDGRDTYVSYAHFAMQVEPAVYAGMSYTDVLGMLIASPDHFGGWHGHVERWTRRTAPTVVVRYEDLLADPAGTAARACEQLGVTLPAPSGSLPRIEELQEIDPLIFRKGKAGSWRDEMPSELEEHFWKLHGQSMERLGYRR
jgi:hypothetical protein